MGYLDEPNHGLANAGFGYQWQMKDASRLEYINLSTYNDYRWHLSSGDQETFQTSLWSTFTFKSQASIGFSVYDYKIDSLSEDWQLDDKNAIAAGTYKMFFNDVSISAPSKSVYTASLISSYGKFYGGKRFFVSPNVSYSFNKHLNIGVTYEYNRIAFKKYLDMDSATLYQSNLLRLRISYIFSTKVSIKLYMQFDDVNHTISSNLRFRYNPREGTDLYIVINQGLNTDVDRLDPHLPKVNNQEVTVKFVKTFEL